MNPETEPKLELTWIQSEGRRKPSLAFETSDSEEGAATRYAVGLWVCTDPRCACYAVHFHCRQIMPDDSLAPMKSVREFWLDVWDRSVCLTSELKADPNSAALAKGVQARLSDAAWEGLYRWFRTEKPVVIQKTEVAEIDATDLPDAGGGRMVGFTDVFPRGLALEFSYENQLWAADEQYCVQLRCDCKETILTFLQYQDAAGREVVRQPKLPSLRYNYHSEAVSAVKSGSVGMPDPRQLLAALKTAHALLNAQLELRHAIMQSLYARSHLAKTTSVLNSLVNASTAAARPAKKRVGRNEPCPCGSGKKFKKCCGG